MVADRAPGALERSETGMGGAHRGRIRVLVADEFALFRQAVRIVLEREADLDVVAEAGSSSDVVVEGERTRPDVALLGVSSSTLDGVAVSAATMRERVPSCRVIVLTDDRMMRRCALRSRPARRATSRRPSPWRS